MQDVFDTRSLSDPIEVREIREPVTSPRVLSEGPHISWEDQNEDPAAVRHSSSKREQKHVSSSALKEKGHYQAQFERLQGADPKSRVERLERHQLDRELSRRARQERHDADMESRRHRKRDKEIRQEATPLMERREFHPTALPSPVSSPEKRRLLGKEYSDQTSQLRRELDLARLASHQIRNSQAHLSQEMQSFKKKLHKHSHCKRGERAIMAACQSELDGFQQRIKSVKSGMTSSKPADSFTSELTLESTWEDFSEIRGAMLTNLKLMHDAQESLVKERFRMDEAHEDDSARLREIQSLMDKIQRQEKYDSETVRKALASGAEVH